MKRQDLPLIPYHPLSCGQVHHMRELLPHMVQFLRDREAAAPKTLTLHPHRPDRMEQRRAA